jgi:LDH2 family malate/lactate/ureidoglycolate dehydrogenase
MAHRPQISMELYRCPALAAEGLHEVRCEECGRCDLETKVLEPDLVDFTSAVLEKDGVPAREAEVTARVLVASDVRGIASHGVARLGRYLAGIRDGYIRPGVEPEIREPAPALAVIDARQGLGQVVSVRAMELALEKAALHGVGLVTVRNSNHYGIAGYYPRMALERRMIGLSMTNAAPLVIPTHGAQAILGTNPIAFGAPAKGRVPFLFDAATSVVPRGKLEVYDRNQKQMPVGWAADEQGYDCQNPGQVLKNLIARAGGGILPLGGRGEEFSGHKGYGLAMLVDILSGVLSGSAFGPDVDDVHRARAEGLPPAARVGHFFMALDVARFMPLDEFEARMEALLNAVRESPRALDQTRIYIHGEKEQARAELHLKAGVPLSRNVFDALTRIAAERGLAPPVTLADRVRRAQAGEELS